MPKYCGNLGQFGAIWGNLGQFGQMGKIWVSDDLMAWQLAIIIADSTVLGSWDNH